MWFFKNKKNEFLNLVEELREDNKLKSFGSLVDSDPPQNLNLSTDKNANSLFVGSMGSGKSVSATTSVFAEMLANPQDLVFTLDMIKGATDFCFLQKYNRFISLVNDDALVETFFDIIFKEFSQRVFCLRRTQSPNLDHYNNINKKKISKINIVIECSEYLMEKILSLNPQTAKQIHLLLKKGNEYGISFVFIAARASNNSFPKTILDNISNIVAFRLNNMAEAQYLNLPEATNILINARGQAVVKKDRVQFMYLQNTTQEKYIEDDIGKNGNPFPCLLTLNESELSEIKQDPIHILKKASSEVNEYVDEEDIDFWNWFNSNI